MRRLRQTGRAPTTKFVAIPSRCLVEALESRRLLSSGTASFLDLGTTLSVAYGFNNNDQVVGTVPDAINNNVTDAAVVNAPSTTPTLLPGSDPTQGSSYAFGINNLGTIVGDATIPVPAAGAATMPAIWSPALTGYTLTVVSDPAYSQTNGDHRLYGTSANAISDTGIVVGSGGFNGLGFSASAGDGSVHGYLSQPPNGNNAYVAGVNKGGAVVGAVYDPLTGYFLATMWDASGNVAYTDSDTIHNSQALSINDNGQFVGSASFVIGGNRVIGPALWQPDGTLEQIPTLAGGTALGINNSGLVLVDGIDANGDAGPLGNGGFVWQNGVETPLTGLLPASSGLQFDQPIAINNNGQILAYALPIGGGARHTMILNLPPTVVSSKVGDGSVQRSSIKSFSVTFSTAVNFTSSSFTLYQATLNPNGTVAGYTNDVSAGVAISTTDNITWTFTDVAGGSLDRNGAGGSGFLSDGVYRLVLHGAAVTDMATGTLGLGVGDQNVSFATNEGGVAGTAQAFHVLYGDINGDGVDNNTDLLAFSRAWTPTNKLYNAALDFNGDGSVNAADLLAFSKRFLKSPLSY